MAAQAGGCCEWNEGTAETTQGIVAHHRVQKLIAAVNYCLNITKSNVKYLGNFKFYFKHLYNSFQMSEMMSLLSLLSYLNKSAGCHRTAHL